MAFELRSPTARDSQFTVDLRSDPRVSQFLHRVPGDLQSQRRWEEAALMRDDDLPLVIYRRSTRRPEGTVGIYSIDRTLKTAEWGRWALLHGSPAAVESVLLVFRLGFDKMGLTSLYSRTLTANSRVIAFHDRLGAQRELDGYLDVDGRRQAYVQHRLSSKAWPALRRRLEPLAEAVASRLA
ncbi:MAG TPA: GNAT family protein [Candidatus Dormibacteraeota bacterium]|jgi:RimJ/RimL family protein N-acetyltransferase|nr:GNAT family protein [Candidatus Dormibacteraeota bacterium]